MRGVSEVIAIILILMITISLAGLAYMFMSTTMADVTSSAGSTVDTTTSSMMTSFTIESMDVAKVYVRNTGQNALTSLSVYVNDEPATYNVTTPIAAGAVGTITIYSFIPDDATVKITSPNGFSASKVANPCEKAVACWKFDEMSGTTAYDSSPYGNTGNLLNGAFFSSGKYGNGLLLDGSNDYVLITHSSSLDFGSQDSIAISFLFKTSDKSVQRDIFFKPYAGWYMATAATNGYLKARFHDGVTNFDIYGTTDVVDNQWHHAVWTIDRTTNIGKLWLDGEIENAGVDISAMGNLNSTGWIGIGYPYGVSYFNGTIDEVRIYNRVIY